MRPSTDALIFGVEFSPDNSKLYAYYMSYYYVVGMGIVQYDLMQEEGILIQSTIQ